MQRHALKIIGSGAPEVMTACLVPSELALWRENLRALLDRLDADEEAWPTTRPFGGYHESREEELRVQRVEVTRLLAETDGAEDAASRLAVVAGPSHLIYHLAHEAAARAADLLVEARRRCGHSHELTNLREPIELLAACVETLEACHWVDAHGWNYYVAGLEDPRSVHDAIVGFTPSTGPSELPTGATSNTRPDGRSRSSRSAPVRRVQPRRRD